MKMGLCSLIFYLLIGIGLFTSSLSIHQSKELPSLQIKEVTTQNCILRDSNSSIVRPYKIIVSVSSNFILVLLNWLVFFQKRCQDFSNLYLLCLNDQTEKYLNRFNLQCSYIQPSVSNFHMVWIHRVLVAKDLLEAGYDVIMSDLDAIWVKDPFEEFNKFPNSDIIGSRASFPNQMAKSLGGATMCMGFFLIRSNPRGIAIWKEMRKLLVNMTKLEIADDQYAMNQLLVKLNLKFPNKLKYLESTTHDTGTLRLPPQVSPLSSSSSILNDRQSRLENKGSQILSTENQNENEMETEFEKPRTKRFKSQSDFETVSSLNHLRKRSSSLSLVRSPNQQHHRYLQQIPSLSVSTITSSPSSSANSNSNVIHVLQSHIVTVTFLSHSSVLRKCYSPEAIQSSIIVHCLSNRNGTAKVQSNRENGVWAIRPDWKRLNSSQFNIPSSSSLAISLMNKKKKQHDTFENNEQEVEEVVENEFKFDLYGFLKSISLSPIPIFSPSFLQELRESREWTNFTLLLQKEREELTNNSPANHPETLNKRTWSYADKRSSSSSSLLSSIPKRKRTSSFTSASYPSSFSSSSFYPSKVNRFHSRTFSDPSSSSSSTASSWFSTFSPPHSQFILDSQTEPSISSSSSSSQASRFDSNRSPLLRNHKFINNIELTQPTYGQPDELHFSDQYPLLRASNTNTNSNSNALFSNSKSFPRRNAPRSVDYHQHERHNHQFQSQQSFQSPQSPHQFQSQSQSYDSYPQSQSQFRSQSQFHPSDFIHSTSSSQINPPPLHPPPLTTSYQSLTTSPQSSSPYIDSFLSVYSPRDPPSSSTINPIYHNTNLQSPPPPPPLPLPPPPPPPPQYLQSQYQHQYPPKRHQNHNQHQQRQQDWATHSF